jgi:hypothetical protein
MSDITVNVTNAGAANVAVSGGSTVNASVGNGGTVKVDIGTISPGNATVVSGTLAINSVTTLAAGSQAYVKNDTGTAFAAKLDIGIPAGPAATVSVGSTTTLESGNASVTGTTSGNNLTLAFAIPRGAAGVNGTNGTNGVTPAITASATTLSAGSSATVTATPSDGGSKVALAFGIPRGADGAAGAGGGASLSDATPSALGTASAGTSSTASRSDHVHTLPSLLTLGAAAANHNHPYVTGLNNLTGELTLAAGNNVSLTASGSTITIAADDDIDGGWFYGTSGLSRSITITSPPTGQTASSGAATFAVTAVAEPSGTLSYQWQKSDSAGFAATQRTLPTSANWYSVAYGNGTFVAVSTGGGTNSIAATSTDGITWTQRAMPVGIWYSVTYGNGTFVAVSSGSPIAATSTDGITWTQRTLPVDATWASVTYGGSTFVAVAYDTAIAATSADGITWTQRTLPASANWLSVAYGGGTFVAVANSYSIAATSTDGITWTQRTLPASANWQSVTHGNGTFVAIAFGNTPAYAATSPDGITWTQRAMPVATSWTSVTYGGGTFVAVAASGNIAATSTDGISWTQRTLPATASWQAVAYGGSTFATVAYNSSIAATITLSGQSDFANVSGATSSTLALTGLTSNADNLDRFRVVVSAANASSVTSQPATLTVS